MAQFLTQLCKFRASDIRMLADSRATHEAIRDRLYWLLDGIKPEGRILFGFSGHGTQVPTQADLGWHLRIASEKKMSALSIYNSAKQLNVALVSGYKSNQTSADTNVKKHYNGAFTYYLLRELNKSTDLIKPLSSVVKNVSAALRKTSYLLEPKLEGHADIIKEPFFKQKASPTTLTRA